MWLARLLQCFILQVFLLGVIAGLIPYIHLSLHVLATMNVPVKEIETARSSPTPSARTEETDQVERMAPHPIPGNAQAETPIRRHLQAAINDVGLGTTTDPEGRRRSQLNRRLFIRNRFNNA